MFYEPKLQLALDMPDLIEALRVTQLASGEIDIIEVGTVLGAADGMSAVRALRALFPHHTLLADLRIVRAGGVMARLAFEAGADWVTVMSDAPDETLEAVLAEARKYGREAQIELGDRWNMDDIRRWRAMGFEQFIFHRSSEVIAVSDEVWHEHDFSSIREMAELGCRVTVTGGLLPEDIQLFKGIPVYVFISGRAICKADDPAAAAGRYREAIRLTYRTERGGSGDSEGTRGGAGGSFGGDGGGFGGGDA